MQFLQTGEIPLDTPSISTEFDFYGIDVDSYRRPSKRDILTDTYLNGRQNRQEWSIAETWFLKKEKEIWESVLTHASKGQNVIKIITTAEGGPENSSFLEEVAWLHWKIQFNCKVFSPMYIAGSSSILIEFSFQLRDLSNVQSLH